MLDNGFLLVIEFNILKELIKLLIILCFVVNFIIGSSNVGDIFFIGQLFNILWCWVGVKYINNEVYFDVVEEIDVIIDKLGFIVFVEIQGVIDVCIKLFGMFDFFFFFMNFRFLDDVSFYFCIWFKCWEFERVLLFIFLDGNF